jgi:hypothetical protein
MTTKDVIKLLEKLNPERELVINIKQYHKRYGFQLSIEEDSMINNSYGGSITVYLPNGAYVVGLPDYMETT